MAFVHCPNKKFLEFIFTFPAPLFSFQTWKHSDLRYVVYSNTVEEILMPIMAGKLSNDVLF
jgi:hypothetical protein